jgi:hypothetical protein
MSKFIKKLFLSLIPFFILFCLIEISLRNIPNDYNYKRNYLDENSNDIEILFLGSSHSYYGINPIFIEENSFNASHISQTINFDFEILNKYKDNWSSLKYLVIPIDYFTFFGRTETGGEAWRVKNYHIYYNLFTSLNLLDYFELFSFDLNTNIKRLSDYYYLNKTNITCSKLGFGNNINTKKDLIESGIIAAKRHTKKDFAYYNKNLDVINSIIEFSKEYQFKIIFYTTPAYKSYVSNLNEKQLNLTVETITKLTNNHDNCTYVNLLKDSSFNSNDFRDADHLSEKGAKKLSLIINDLFIE